jgi:hypothetical protein
VFSRVRRGRKTGGGAGGDRTGGAGGVRDDETDVARREEAEAEVRLLPIRPRSRVDRRSLRTFHVVTLHPRFPFNV